MNWTAFRCADARARVGKADSADMRGGGRISLESLPTTFMLKPRVVACACFVDHWVIIHVMQRQGVGTLRFRVHPSSGPALCSVSRTSRELHVSFT